MLRQDPVECLFQFVCSSNNHISRIHGMVERLCSLYGSPLALASASASAAVSAPSQFTPGVKEDVQHPRTSMKQEQSLRQLGVVEGVQPEAQSSSSSRDTGLLHGGATCASFPLAQGTTAEFKASISSAPISLPGGTKAEIRASVGTDLVLLPVASDVEEFLKPSVASSSMPSFYAFPTLQQLAAATEDELRASGFG